MPLWLIVLIVLVLLNYGGGHVFTGYTASPGYNYSWGGILLIVLILFFVSGRL